MKVRNVLAVCLAALMLPLSTPFSSCHAKAGKPKYKLVWKDNFKGNTYDNNSWSKISRGKPDWCKKMSDDDRLYDVKDGLLILRGCVNDGSYQYEGKTDTARYVTGGLFTKGKRFIGYGKVEVRARLGCAQGAWPAIWMLPEKGGWPDNGEIDIMEHLNHDSIAYQTVHSYYTYTLKETKNPPQGATGPIRPGEFNTYTVEILPDSLVLSINGTKTLTYPRINTDKRGQYPFGQPSYLLIDVQIEGSWVGKARPEEYPVQMEIDWVKMYELKQ